MMLRIMVHLRHPDGGVSHEETTIPADIVDNHELIWVYLIDQYWYTDMQVDEWEQP